MYERYQLSTAKYQTSKYQNTSIHTTDLCGLFLFWENMPHCNGTILYIYTIDMYGNVENM